MQMLDIAVVGSGMGGAMIAALNKHQNILVFEKDANVGGCASTFKHKGAFFNAGATTFVGYEEGHPLYNMFKRIGFKPELILSSTAMQVLHKQHTVTRSSDFEQFLKELEKAYPHPNNRLFWQKIKSIDEAFWKLQKLHFAKHSLKGIIKSLIACWELFQTFGFELFTGAQSFIKTNLPNISQEYQDFLDAQLLITLQTKTKNLSLLAMALGLAYPFHKVFYAKGGMGAVIQGLLKDVPTHTKEEIIHIEPQKQGYILHSKKARYFAKNVILNATVYDASKLFHDQKIKRYYERFDFSDQSAFVLYIKLKNTHKLAHHYQVITPSNFVNCISNALFVSFADENDVLLNKEGQSITLSTHTKANFWKTLSKEQYEQEKERTKKALLDVFLTRFDTIKQEDITFVAAATSLTFKRFIKRTNCGGKAISLKNLPMLPSCTTPFKGLFNVGDTVFAGQGWPGVCLGVEVLQKELHAEF